MTWHAGIFSLEGDGGYGGEWEEVGSSSLLFFLSHSLFLHTPSAHQFIRLLHGTLSPEEKPWVGVCNFWWMNTSLTHSPFIWLFNLDSLCFFPHLSFALSLNLFLSLSGLCSSLKTVVADLIGLCWTLALCCISYDHLEDSLTQASCEVQLCNIVWTLLSDREASQLQVFQVYCADEFINYL